MSESDSDSQKIVWIKVENLEPVELHSVSDAVKRELPEHKVVVTTDNIDLIDAKDMKQELEQLIDDE